MAKTFKEPPKQNLLRVPVLIEDTKFYSEYFEISGLNRILHAGKNGFLIRGSEFLSLNSEISIEVVDRFGNAVFSTPASGFSEAGSRLVSIEIYQKTYRGPGKLVILGTADRYSNGKPIPSRYRGRPNVRWVVPIQIEPRNQNTSKIRLANNPIAVVDEKEFATTRIDTTTVTDVLSTYTASLQYDYATHKSDGYAITMLSGSYPIPEPVAFFNTSNADAYFTGSIVRRIIESSSLGTISVVSNYTTASVSMSLDKILNETTAITNTPIKFGDGSDYLNPFLHSGSYRRVIKGNDSNNKRTIEEYTSSVVFQYPSESVVSTAATSSIVNFRIPFVETYTGEISKVKIGAKEANDNITSFQPFAEFVPGERNLIVATSFTGDTAAGVLTSRNVLDSNWFGALTTKTNGDFNRAVYENSGSLGLDHPITLVTSSQKILNGLHADHTSSAVSYFIGSSNHYQLYRDIEYTLKYTAVYTPTHVTSSNDTAVATYTTANTGSVKAFITRIGSDTESRNSSSIASNDAEPVRVGAISKYGMLIDDLHTRTKDKSLYEQEVNFTVPRNGVNYLRFKVDEGFWHFGNIEITPAVEKGFHPDEIIFDAENNTLTNTTNVFKIQFLNFEDNPIDYEIITSPLFVSGSRLAKSLRLISDATTFTFGADGDPDPAGQTASLDIVKTNVQETITFTIVDDDGTTVLPAHTETSATNAKIYVTAFGFQSQSAAAVTAGMNADAKFTSSVLITATAGDLTDKVRVTRVKDAAAGAAGVAGAAGSDSKTVNLTANNYVVIYSGSGTAPTPSVDVDVGLTASAQNFDDPYFKFTGDGISDESSYSDGAGGASDTFIWPVPADYFTDPKTVKVSVQEGSSGGEVAFDTVTLTAVKPGVDATTIVLTNEAHSIPANSAGTVTSYSNSGTDIKVWQGATALPYDDSAPYTAGSFRVTSAGTNITAGANSTVSTYTRRYGDHNSMTADNASIAYTITVTDTSGTAVGHTKLQTFSKTKGGASGSGGAGIVFRGDWSASVAYTGSATRTDVVRHEGIYYVANTSHMSTNNTTSGTGKPATNPPWSSFGTTFESVATDILFSKDVYADRTVNIGTSASGSTVIALNADSGSYTNPHIAIGQSTAGLRSGSGIFLGYANRTGSFLLSGSTGKSLLWDGTELHITGGFSIDTGDVGGWAIGAHTLARGSGDSAVTVNSANGIITLGAKTSLTDSNTGTYLGTDGIATGASSVFKVTSAGAVTATNATITGNITATDGTIGGWNIDSDAIFVGTKDSSGYTGATGDITFYSDGSNSSIHAKNFYIDASGNLTATSATLTGTVTATAGAIGGWSINSTSIYTGTEDHAAYTQNAGDMTFYSDGSDSSIHAYKFYINSAGELVCTDATLTGTITANAGQIAGWTIDGANDRIQSSDGQMRLKAGGIISLGTGTDAYGAANRVYLDGANNRMSIGSAFSYNNNQLTLSGNATLGGWTVTSTTLYSSNIILDSGGPKIQLGSKESLTDGNTGMYLGTDGIALGASSVFKVTAAGALTATNATITGTVTANAGSFTGTVTAAAGTIGGWTISSNKLAASTHLQIFSDSKEIDIASSTFGATGIQLQYNSGTPRFHVGQSGGSYMKFDGTNAEISASKFKLSSDGSITATDATFSGTCQANDFTLTKGSGTFTIDDAAFTDMVVTSPLTVGGSNTAEISMKNAAGTEKAQISLSGDGVQIYSDSQIDFCPGNVAGKVFISSAGKLGVGTGFSTSYNPENLLHIDGSDYANSLLIQGGGETSGIQFKDDGGNVDGYIYAGHTNIGFLDTGGDWTIMATNNSQIIFSTSAARRMSIYNSGEVLIGSSDQDPDGFLHVQRGSAGSVAAVTNSTLVLENSGNNYMSFLNRDGDNSGFYFGEADDNDRASIIVDGGTNDMTFRVDNNVIMTLDSADTRVGVKQASPAYDLDVTGNIRATTDVLVTSDIRLKNVIGGVTNALSTVNKLNAIRYTWKDERDDKKHIGFSAQDVLELVPEAVYGSEEEEYGISYGKLVPVLVEAIKELTAEVEALKKKVED